MFKNIPYKKKVIYAAVLTALMLMASYKKNFKKVLHIDKQLATLRSNQLENRNFTADIQYLKQEIKVIEKYIGDVNVSPESIQQQIIKFISKTTSQIEIVDIEGIHHASFNQFKVYTNQITVSGDYKNLITLLHTIEKEFSSAKITSTHFYVTTDYRRNRKELFLKIIFQNYEKV